MFKLNNYDYCLPTGLIAQEPVDCRDQSRLLVLDCLNDRRLDRRFGDIVDYMGAGDLVVINDTKVFPARLIGRKETGGRVELFILGYPRASGGGGEERLVTVTALMKSSKGGRSGTRLFFGDKLQGVVLEKRPDGKVEVALRFRGDIDEVLGMYGRIPLPPYIKRPDGCMEGDRERYQTVYARRTGAVAAPTAGLHFTEELMGRIRRLGCGVVGVTLHVGHGTFAPVRVEDIREHGIHEEFVEVDAAAARAVNAARAAGKTIWVIGTTTARALESAADEDGVVRPFRGLCGTYIYPGYNFKVVKNLLTNFHLPRSSLLFLVSALAGRERIMAAYRHAVDGQYRFYSYGDAMLIMT